MPIALNDEAEPSACTDGAERGAGFVDFAIGPYSQPELAVEFSAKFGWDHEEVTYDFVKLLDRRNPFRVGFAHVVILRDKNLATDGGRDHLEERMQAALVDAKRRLDIIGWDNKRDLRLIISEIATHERRHWTYDSAGVLMRANSGVLVPAGRNPISL
jgi:hypothetical protein